MPDSKFLWLLCLLWIIPSSLAQDDDAYRNAQAQIRQAQENNINAFSLWGMGLTTLPPEIGELTNLVHLDLSDNQLETIPDVVFTLPNLTKLTVTGNGLVELSPKIAQLTQLRELDVSDNLLTELPPEIGALTNLRKLTALNNQLTTLPPEIGNLDALQVLNVGDNQITHLPAIMGNMESLTGLWVADNQLNTLPDEIGSIESLRWMNMERNPNRGLPRHVFRSRNSDTIRYGSPDNDMLLEHYKLQWQAIQTTQNNLLLLFGIVIGLATLLAFVKFGLNRRRGKRKRKPHKH